MRPVGVQDSRAASEAGTEQLEEKAAPWEHQGEGRRRASDAAHQGEGRRGAARGGNDGVG